MWVEYIYIGWIRFVVVFFVCLVQKLFFIVFVVFFLMIFFFFFNRCVKNFCIVILREMWDEEELKELQWFIINIDSEEFIDGLDLIDDVSVENVNIDIFED